VVSAVLASEAAVSEVSEEPELSLEQPTRRDRSRAETSSRARRPLLWNVFIGKTSFLLIEDMLWGISGQKKKSGDVNSPGLYMTTHRR
jgi:hypothetical protein